MNLALIKNNPMIVAFSAAFLLVFGGVGWHYWQQQAAYRQVEGSLEEQQLILSQLLTHNPTPTRDNDEALDRKTREFESICKNLHDLSHRSPRHITSLNASNNIAFSQQLRKTLGKLEDQARAANVVVPKDFRFGFKRYATTLPKPQPELLNRLAHQLHVIHELTGILIRDGIEQIDGIYRIELEPDTAGATDDILHESITSHPKEHFTEMPFELRFSCNAAALQKVLNHIAAADYFYVIRMVHIEQEVVTDKKLSDTSPASPVPDSEAASAKTVQPTRPPRLNVTLRLDYIEFTPPESKSKGGN